MNLRILLPLFCIFTCISCYSQLTRRALFLGNSYTYFNNMPQIVSDVAHSTGDSLMFDSYAPGGYTFDDHDADPISQAKIAAGNWDYVVLQEQSQQPSFQNYTPEGVFSLSDLNAQYSPCGRLMFYMTWGRENGDPGNCTVWPPVCTYIGMDTLIRRRYIEMAALFNGELSPAGAAWRYIRQHSPNINLYQADGSHPTQAGSYLVACCFYSAIFKKDPTLINYNYALSAADADTLKHAVKLVVFDSLAYWGHVLTTPLVNFNYTIGNGINQVNFLNSSQFCNSYLWNFGDGDTSSLPNPVHSYAADGTYTITLTGYNCDMGMMYQAIQQATVNFCSYNLSIFPDSLRLCPGYSDTLRTQAYSSYQWLYGNGTPVPNGNQPYIVVSGSNTFYVQVSQNNCTEISAPADVNFYANLSSYELQSSGQEMAPDTACLGDSILLVLSADKPPLPIDQFVDWTLNGQPIADFHNDTLVISASGVYGVTLRHEVCSNITRFNDELNYVFISCVTGVRDQQKDLPMLIYPNPSNGILTLQLRDADRYGIYTISDVLGNTVQQGNLEQSKTLLDLRTLDKGVYFLRLGKTGVSRCMRLIRD